MGLPAGVGPAAGMGLPAGSGQAARAAVTFVAKMTDRFAFRTAIATLGWDPAALPLSV